MVLPDLADDRAGCLVGAVLPAGGPQDDQVAAPVPLDAEDGEIRGPDLVAVAQQFPLDLVESAGGQADRREDGLAVLVAVLPDDDVAAAEVLEVVGEGAQRLDSGVGVPARLVLDPVPLDRPLA